jgi:EsV-1-7 cysteine-rich motif
MVRPCCKHMGCKKCPIYNIEGEKKGAYCKDHKKDGMVCVTIKKCIEEGCTISARFNKKGLKKSLYCKAHMKPGMVDVVHKACAEKDCDQRATYNKKGLKELYCSMHKKEGMIDVRHKPCIAEGCTKEPSYGFKGKKSRIYCAEHKKDDMVYVIVHRPCKTPHCPVAPSAKYEGYCMTCFIHTFPDKPVARNYKTKEQSVVEYIKAQFPQYTIVTDKKVMDGCSKKRPDILFDLGDQVIIVEVDENQHKDYECSCENKRRMELSQDIGHRPLVFIRFNPDSYKNKEENITSCWSINGNGVCVVKKTKSDEWQARLAALKDSVSYWLENKTDKMVEVVQMFYDC